MNNLLSILLLSQPQEGGQSSPMQFLPLILIVVVFYFFMIRPQVKKQKELKNFRESLQKGDKIVTTGGIYGKIVSITDTVITIDVGNGVSLRVDKNAVLKEPADIQQNAQK